MASRAPLVLAAALFVLGIAGLAQTVRQTGSGALPAPLTDLAMQPLTLPTALQSVATPAEAVSAVTVPPPEPTIAAGPSPTVLAPLVPEAAATATPEPTPDSHGGAIAVGVAADGNETTAALAATAPLHPLRLGMIASDDPGSAATPTPTTTPAPTATSTPAAGATVPTP